MEKDAWNAFVGEYNSYFSTTREHIAVVWLRLYVNDLPLSLFKVPQKQTVPVAPRTRISSEESPLEVIHVQNRLPALSSHFQAEEPREQTAEGIQGPLIMFFKSLY